MAIVDLFSKRQKRIRGDVPDVYVYEKIPQPLRIQIIHIIRDTIGQDNYESKAHEVYEFIHKSLCKKYGVFTLNEHCGDDGEAVLHYFLNCDDYERCLDIIEICFGIIEKHIAKNYYNFKRTITSSQKPDDSINELNSRFKESGIGYQFESSELIRVDSKFLHSETVKPILQLLGTSKVYRGANDEFLSAHEHYRHKTL